MKNTKDPKLLSEIFSALDNKKNIILEALIRPILVERLFQSWCLKFKEYGLSEEIEEWLKNFDLSFEDSNMEDSFPEEDFNYLPLDGWDNGILDDPIPSNYGHKAIWTGSEMIVCGGISSFFDKKIFIYKPSIDIWEKKDSPYDFYIYGSSVIWTGEELIIWGGIYMGSSGLKGVIYNPSLDSWREVPPPTFFVEGRFNHTAVWTGESMIIWGGNQYSYYYLNTGAIFNLNSNSWKLISTKNCPEPRANHSAVWTGSKMIIWGGENYPYYLNSGGIYDPLKDEWKTIRLDTTTPSPRVNNSAIWTGKEMIIWGGEAYYNSLIDGAIYDPQKNTWRKIYGGDIYPSERSRHSTIWTGEKVIIWGGCKIRDYQISEIYDDGFEFDPFKNEWKQISTRGVSPSKRFYHSAIWTGEEMIIWGGLDESGSLNSGGRFKYNYNLWLPISEGAFAPKARSSHTAVWTGTEMIIFGGSKGGYPKYEYLSDGASYIPGLDLWFYLSAPSFPSKRAEHKAIWTGLEMIVWGGRNEIDYLKTGARYDPLNNTWQETSTLDNCPSKRAGHIAVWAGEEMIIWGGYDGKNFLNSGARYDPEKDEWKEISQRGNPLSPRAWHSGVWTGSEMILWGGLYFPYKYWKYRNDGFRYGPLRKEYIKLESLEFCPQYRAGHTAVWTAESMIIWGGTGWDGELKNGCIYFPGKKLKFEN